MRVNVLDSGVEYMNQVGQLVVAQVGTSVYMVRRLDVKKYLKEEKISVDSAEIKSAKVMTSVNIDGEKIMEAEVKYEVGDLVGFSRGEEEYTGEIMSITAGGRLTVDVGVEKEEKLMKVHPRKTAVEKLA